MNELPQQVVVLILSAGGATAIFTIVKSVIAWRNSVDTREATGIANLERWRMQADRRADRNAALLDHEKEVSAHWRSRAGLLEYTLNVNGIPIPPAPPLPKKPVFSEEGQSQDSP